jgi:hypothetical protein
MFLAASSLLVAAGGADAEPLRAPSFGGRTVEATLERSQGSSQSLLVILSGDACPPAGALTRSRGVEIAGAARLMVREPLVQGEGCNPERLEGRLVDALAVLAELRRDASWWNGKLYLVGEGADVEVARALARLAPETEALVLLQAGASSSQGFDAEPALAPTLWLRAAGPGEALVASTRLAENVSWRVAANAEVGQIASEFLLRRNARVSSAAANPKPAVAAASDKKPRADAPPRPARVATARPAPAAPAPRVAAPTSLRLRASLPATPGPPPETRPASRRTSADTAPPSIVRRP